MTDPTPAIRERHMIHHETKHLVTLAPLELAPTPARRAPTPLDVRHTAVTQAVHRAARTAQPSADLRVLAARSRTTRSAPGNRASVPADPPSSGPQLTSPTPAHRR